MTNSICIWSSAIFAKYHKKQLVLSNDKIFCIYHKMYKNRTDFAKMPMNWSGVDRIKIGFAFVCVCKCGLVTKLNPYQVHSIAPLNESIG